MNKQDVETLIELFLDDFKNGKTKNMQLRQSDLFNSMTQFILSDNSETIIYDIFCSKIQIMFLDLIKIKETEEEQSLHFLKLFEHTKELISMIEKICFQIPFTNSPMNFCLEIFIQLTLEDEKFMEKIERYIIKEVDKKENARRFHPLPKLAENLFKTIVELKKDSINFSEEFHKKTKRYIQKFKDDKETLERNEKFWKKVNQRTDHNIFKPRYNIIYPEDDETNLKNIQFYRGKIQSSPDQVFISDFHEKWFGRYDKLEMGHGFIQWLFPIREGGLNFDAQSLTKNESKQFRESKELQSMIIKSYKLMLNFYGIKLENEILGTIKRDDSNWRQRYNFLNDSFHNYLRITRILNCLELTGLGHYKIHLINHFIIEIFQNGYIKNAKSSLIEFWIPTLRKNSEIKSVEKIIYKLTGKRINRKDFKVPSISWAYQFEFDEKDSSEEETEQEGDYGSQQKKEFRPFQGKGRSLE